MKFFKKITASLIIIALVIAAAFIIPWETINWGEVSLKPSSTITVTGSAQKQLQNEVASFNAGVTAMEADKEVAVEEVNQKVAQIIEAVKSFGVPAEDIKTQNLSIYQHQRDEFNEDSQKKWRVSNNIEIKLKDAAQADELAELLANTQATSVHGPNFTLERSNNSNDELLRDAIEDAKAKAQLMAEASGKKLGEVISVNEGSNSGYQPFRMMAEMDGAGGGPPIEPGTSSVVRSVTVVFSLK